MEAVYYLIVVFILLGSTLLLYNIGYRKGAKRVLNEWKEVNKYFGDNKCPHGHDWDQCPDCSH